MLRELFLAVVAGIPVNLAVGFLFYWKSTKGLRREAEELRRLNVLIIRALEGAGLADVHRDSAGKVVGLKVNFRGSMQIASSMRGALTVDKGPEQTATG